MDTKENLSQDQNVIFDQIKEIISETIGPDVMEELNITKESTFSKDLEMDSIEFVAFIDKVNNHYGKTIDFPGWLFSMDLDKLINLSIESLIVFISENIENAKN